MIIRTSTLIAVVVLFVNLILISPSMAQDSLLISYQGRLTDAGGNPVTGTLSMTFTIYDVGRVSKWTETQLDVEVTNGLFSVMLGSQTALPDSVLNDEDRYLGITVNGDPEISPRTLLTSAPGAAVSKRVIGDIITAPGILQILQPPPDDGMPGITMSTSANMNMFKINWGVPPDDQKPAIGMTVNALDNIGWLSLTNHSPSGSAPGVVMNSGADMSKFAVGWFQPPPDDDQPPPDDQKPMALFSSNATAGAMSIIGPNNAGFVPSQIQMQADNSQAQVLLSSQSATGGIIPIVMTADQSSASVGIGTETPGAELYVVGDITATGAITELSSLKYKTNINRLDNTLDLVDNLRGVSFNWRVADYPEMRFSEDQQVGLIAEEVEKVIPQLVHSDNNGEKSVDYSKLTAILIEAVKEQQKQIENLSQRVEELEGTIVSSR